MLRNYHPIGSEDTYLQGDSVLLTERTGESQDGRGLLFQPSLQSGHTPLFPATVCGVEQG